MSDFLIDSLLPTKRVHLLGGTSNIGKSRWLLPTLVGWSGGKSVMGFSSHPVPWAYVSGDRLLVEAQDTIRSLGIPLESIPIIPAFGQHNKTWIQVLEVASKMNLGLLAWEGFGDLVPPPGLKNQVREFLSAMSAHCCGERSSFPNGLTIIGVMESPKMKPSERYKSPRERISGVASWGYHTSSVMLIEAADPENVSDPRRVFHASLKNASSFTAQGEFDSSGHIRFGLPDIGPTIRTEEEIIEEMREYVNRGNKR